jgi:hypothetical protein
MRKHLFLIIALLTPVPGFAAPSSKLLIPSFDGLARKASESVAITLDSAMLGLAGRFLDGNDPQDAATKDILKGLTGIYVRSYSFDKDSAYERSDLDAVRSQLSAPGWSRLMETRSSKSRSDVDIYIMIDNNQAVGLALIASEPRQFTIVNIVGAIDLDKLHKLEGQFGVPKLDLEQSKPLPGQPAPRK